MGREKKQQQQRKKKSLGQLSFPEIKKLKQCDPYAAASCIPCDSNFWDTEQKELYDQIYRHMKVFQHKFVEWSDIDEAEACPYDLSTKYEALGLKALASNNSSWVWNEDVVKQFYGTLYVNPSRQRMDFMIGSRHCSATKEDLEKALLIEPRADSLVLHTWNDVDFHSLFLVPDLDTSLVRDLKTEVALIQKINRETLLPRSGSRGSCSTIICKLAYAIYHGKHFDIAHFLLSEMCEAIETPNHGLPYAPHIFCLLRHLKVDLRNIETKCCLKKYFPQLPKLNFEQLAALAKARPEQPEVTEVRHEQPEVTEVRHQQHVPYSCQPQHTSNPDSTVASIGQLSKSIEGLHEIVIKGFGTMEKRLDTMEHLFSGLSSEISEIKAYMSEPCHVLNYKQKRARTEVDTTMDMTQVLLAAQSMDGNLRSIAEDNLNLFQEQNLPNFLLSLSVEISSDERPPESRRLAGIILKNTLDLKNSSKKELLIQQWVNLDPSIKSKIKEALLITLGSLVPEARQASSRVVAKIASIEIPRWEWKYLIARLQGNIMQDGASAALKQATLEALGYVCEEIPPEHLEQDQVNAILNAVVRQMNQAEQSAEVRLAAVKALYNALDFSENNFANVMERSYIVKVICDTVVSQEVEIRQAAFECLVAIASTYYVHLNPYMQTIFNLTANAVKGDEESVALQAIEFWSAVCDEEIKLQEDYEGSDDANSRVNYYFIEKALPLLVPMLLETLLNQEEYHERADNVWNIFVSAAKCLGLIARTVGDAIVPLVMPFVEANITNRDWHCREAATSAFDSILEGPSIEKLTFLVQARLDLLLNTMNDPNSQVKSVTAWTLGRVFKLLHSSASATPIITDANLPRIMTVLLEGSKDVPNVAKNVCGAIYCLAQGYEDSESSSSVLTPYLPNLITALLCASDHAGTTHLRLRTSAYKALNEVVRVSSIVETSGNIGQLCLEIMRRLNLTFDLQLLSLGDREKQSDLQALLCGVLQVIIQKLSNSEAKSVIAQTADQLMFLFLRLFACRSSSVHEEAMLAIRELAYATGPDFLKYMPDFFKYLEAGLQNYEEYQVCSVYVGVVGDICRAVEDKILPFCDGIMTVLLKNLSNPMLTRSIRPPIFSCFGDIALAIGVNFEKYLPYAMPMLQGASELLHVLDQSDDDAIDHGNQLSRGIFEAYSGILQGLKGPKALLMVPYARHLLHFTEAVYTDLCRDESVTKAAVAVLGDLADILGPASKDLFKVHLFHVEFLRECLNADGEIREAALWAQGVISEAGVS